MAKGNPLIVKEINIQVPIPSEYLGKCLCHCRGAEMSWRNAWPEVEALHQALSVAYGEPEETVPAARSEAGDFVEVFSSPFMNDKGVIIHKNAPPY